MIKLQLHSKFLTLLTIRINHKKNQPRDKMRKETMFIPNFLVNTDLNYTALTYKYAFIHTVQTLQLYIHVYQVTLLILVNSDISRTNSSSLKSGYEILSTSILSSEKNCMYSMQNIMSYSKLNRI